MFSSFRTYLAVILTLLIFATPWVAQNYPDQVQEFAAAFENAAWQAASVILHNPRTIAELQTKYATTSFLLASSAQLSSSTLSSLSSQLPDPSTTAARVRILLVPGHEPDFGGAEYGSLKERDMNVELAQDLATLLENDPHFQVYITRDKDAWNPVFADYFRTEWDSIKAWQKDSHDELMHLIAIGSTTQPVSKVFHNTAPTDVALRLYGITKWANDNIVDVVIHIHFNDYADHRNGVSGTHYGFAIYVPVQQFKNSTTTKAVANAVFKRLDKHYYVSNLPGESTGIVDEPDLIAIGSNDTADAASMLIEYGYIYEPEFSTPAKRTATFKKMANDTYLGLLDFFTSDIRVTPRYF